MGEKNFSKKLIDWYHEHHRKLPWRETTDPYKIWLSEIILQQTRVAQGLPYYEKFIQSYNNVKQLANAPQDQVLRSWQGLGYYSRARNLHACAKKIADEFNGEFPQTYNQLLHLPGIGSYTAAAIASIAFKERVAVVDGNVFRVLARVFGIDKDISLAETRNFFFAKANQLIDNEHPDLFNQAIMEFGATHCMPKNPKCDDCIFSKTCFARSKQMQSQLPVKSKKTVSKKKILHLPGVSVPR